MSQLRTVPRVATWCALCGAQHSPDASCPRQIDATGREASRWRVAAQTPEGVRGFGVMVAEAGTRWRARIVTFPNVLWMIPGGGETMKFFAKSESECIRMAVDFLRDHCIAKGFLMRDELQVVETRRRSVVVGSPVPGVDRHAPRYDRRLPVKFGRSRPTIQGFTANLSETGLFIETPTPLGDGELLGLTLELEHCKVPLRGSVAWQRNVRNAKQGCGMGLRLVNPPAVYVSYIRALG